MVIAMCNMNINILAIYIAHWDRGNNYTPSIYSLIIRSLQILWLYTQGEILMDSAMMPDKDLFEKTQKIMWVHLGTVALKHMWCKIFRTGARRALPRAMTMDNFIVMVAELIVTIFLGGVIVNYISRVEIIWCAVILSALAEIPLN